MSPIATEPDPVQSGADQRLRHSRMLGLLVVFLVLNVLTASRYPFVWIDEVMYTDPAANLLHGKGFTSTAWYAQNADEFWAGNVPGHSLLLYCWMKVFGFSVTAVRSINFVYVGVACWLLWLASIRLSLIRTERMGLWMVVLILSGYGTIFAYRSGRPDSLALLLVSAFVFFYAQPERWRLPAYLLLGAAVPWVGLQLVPMLVTGGTLLLVFAGVRRVWPLAVAGAGAAGGMATLAWLYHSQGVWDGFLRSVRQHTLAGVWDRLFGGNLQHSNFLPKDFSFVPLLLLAFYLVWVQWRAGKLKARSLLVFGIVFSTALSVALVVGGKFPTYYGWMTYVPLCVCVCSTLGSMPAGHRTALPAVLMMLATAAAGIVPHGAAAASDWQHRDYDRVRTFVRQSLPTDGQAAVYTDFGAYYAVRELRANVITYYYLPMISETEKAAVSHLVIAPRNAEEVTRKLGGNWARTGKRLESRPGLLGHDWRAGFLSMNNYTYEVFRRE